jgi:hypothetical protein
MKEIEQRIERGIRKNRVSGTRRLPGVILVNVIMLTILTVMTLPGNVFAQKDNIHFEHLSLKHGLSQASVYCIMQDNPGFYVVWHTRWFEQI